jgi:hypothetical protein
VLHASLLVHTIVQSRPASTGQPGGKSLTSRSVSGPVWNPLHQRPLWLVRLLNTIDLWGDRAEILAQRGGMTAPRASSLRAMFGAPRRDTDA